MAESPVHASPALPEQAVRAIRGLFASAVTEHRTSGVSWAVIGGHAHPEALLAHGAAGHRELVQGLPADGSGPMDRGTVSRIASMTKSFTAASVLALRDEGALRLDDPVEQHLPEARGAFETTGEDAPITLRDLLTMGAGLITDNPWGDRQEAMTRAGFAGLLRGGLGHTRRPGTGFEYSNTGYALLGRVIDEVAGEDHAAFIGRRFLGPLGMEHSGFRHEDIDSGSLATGHRVADRTDATRFEPVPLDGPGVYGAMAGLFSTVDDVAAWVRFLAAADAPHGAAAQAVDGPAPLRAASRREMQQVHRHQRLPALPAGEDGRSPGYDRVRGYGYGLVVETFPDLGEIISHSGGYPGYGSFMAWHRRSGVGVLALANSKYAPAAPLSMEALRVLAREAPELLSEPAPEAAPRTLAAADAALAWLRSDDDALADAWFADNMDLDIPRPERRRRLAAALEAAGVGGEALAGLRADQAEVLTRAHLRWTVHGTGEQGRDLRLEVLLDPRREGLIQSLDTLAVAR